MAHPRIIRIPGSGPGRQVGLPCPAVIAGIVGIIRVYDRLQQAQETAVIPFRFLIAELPGQFQGLVTFLFGTDEVIVLYVVPHIREMLLHVRPLARLGPAPEKDCQADPQDDGRHDHCDEDRLPDPLLPFRVLEHLVHVDGGKGIVLQVLRLSGEQQVLHLVTFFGRLVSRFREYVLQLPLVHVLPDATGIQGDDVTLLQPDLPGEVRVVGLIPEKGIQVVPLFMLCQPVLADLLFLHQILPLGHVKGGADLLPVPVQPEPGIAGIPVTALLVIRHHHGDRCLQPLKTFRMEQLPVCPAQVTPQLPPADARLFLECIDHCLYRRPGALGTVHMRDAVGHHVTGIAVQLHEAKIIIVLKPAACLRQEGGLEAAVISPHDATSTSTMPPLSFPFRLSALISSTMSQAFCWHFPLPESTSSMTRHSSPS